MTTKPKLTDNEILENLVSSLEGTSANFTYERVERLKAMAKEILEWRKRDLPTELDKSYAESQRLEDELIEERSLRLGRLGILEDPAFRIALRGATVEVQVGIEMSVMSHLDFIDVIRALARGGNFHVLSSTSRVPVTFPESEVSTPLAPGASA